MRVAIYTSALLMVIGCRTATDITPHWDVERDAVPSATHPYGGFWKSDPGDDWGLAIGPYEADTYYVSFCGPGGCFAKGEGLYRPITSLTNDPDFYTVIDLNTIEVGNSESSKTYFRSEGRALTKPNKDLNQSPSYLGSRLD